MPRLARRLHTASAACAAARPDVLVTVDAKGFTLRAAARVRKLCHAEGVPPPAVVHYVAPSFWAFRGGGARLPGLRGLVDEVAPLCTPWVLGFLLGFRVPFLGFRF